jgi:hypothetical protein
MNTLFPFKMLSKKQKIILKRIPETFLSVIFTERLQHCQTSDDFVGTSFVVLQKMSEGELKESTIKKEKERSALLSSNALFAIAEIDLTLEICFPDYDGPR